MTDSRLSRLRRRWPMTSMHLWHAAVSGGFLVAWLTADVEDLYMLHQVAGYTVLGAIGLRLAVGLVARKVPWRLPRPAGALRTWRDTGGRGRNPLFALIALALLVLVGGAAVSGMAAHWVTAVEDLHEGLSNASLWVVFGHIAFILVMYGGKRWVTALWRRLATGRPRSRKPATAEGGVR